MDIIDDHILYYKHRYGNSVCVHYKDMKIYLMIGSNYLNFVNLTFDRLSISCEVNKLNH